MRFIVLAACFCLSFTANIHAEDFPKGTFTIKGPNDQVLAIAFDGKGKLVVTMEDQEVVSCDYKVTKDQIEFSNETGPKADSDSKPGTYKWKLDGKKLTFTKVKDESKGRSQALTFGTWERK